MRTPDDAAYPQDDQDPNDSPEHVLDPIRQAALGLPADLTITRDLLDRLADDGTLTGVANAFIVAVARLERLMRTDEELDLPGDPGWV
jgi:hypothetical protein